MRRAVLCRVPPKHLWSLSWHNFKERHLEAVDSTLCFSMLHENHLIFFLSYCGGRESFTLCKEDTDFLLMSLFAQLVGRCVALGESLHRGIFWKGFDVRKNPQRNHFFFLTCVKPAAALISLLFYPAQPKPRDEMSTPSVAHSTNRDICIGYDWVRTSSIKTITPLQMDLLVAIGHFSSIKRCKV